MLLHLIAEQIYHKGIARFVQEIMTAIATSARLEVNHIYKSSCLRNILHMATPPKCFMLPWISCGTR